MPPNIQDGISVSNRLDLNTHHIIARDADSKHQNPIAHISGCGTKNMAIMGNSNPVRTFSMMAISRHDLNVILADLHRYGIPAAMPYQVTEKHQRLSYRQPKWTMKRKPH
ncbi:hypothetical protein BIY26_13610 [Brenneria goodwinii]|uniref:Uncharacterized protein n=1 Tax=Brenneria goodwinii TaxID=1109412 RepID=A0AAE8ESF8_9GAMM|nr:hypothetical protein AWC36_03775 [Brenneria goodwinii]RLM22052.1 hypothetical protein BIY26_13610 [Brenneria goodwinii]